MKVKIDGDEPETPKIVKGVNIMRWSKSWGNAMAWPMSHLFMLLQGMPANKHSAEAGFVEEELIARASHTHTLLCEDNDKVYFKLEAATRGTSYAASIKPFQWQTYQL
jgi:hypothetical protein